MSISAAWPFADTGASISAVNISLEPAHSGLPFGAAPPTVNGVLVVSEQIGGASCAWCGQQVQPNEACHTRACRPASPPAQARPSAKQPNRWDTQSPVAPLLASLRWLTSG